MIRALLVDDEQPARDRLRSLLGEIGGVEVLGEARDGPEAIESIAALRPDLVFLDIEMPGLSGMEVAAALPAPRPRIVFCTAFDQYAIAAFEQHATDYLLKPVGRRRLAGTVERVQREIGESQARFEELAEAGRTQARLLPQRLPPMARLDYDGVCRPARGVGGDYYDFLPLGPGTLGVVVSDVCGKGLYAGLLAASLQARLQALAPIHGGAPAVLAGELNRALLATLETHRYATLFYARYDERERSLRWVNAGHVAALVLRPRAGPGGLPVARLESGGPALGMLAGAEYREATLDLAPGDVLLAYTDGLTETRNSDGEELGEARLIDLAAAHADAPVRALRDAILAGVDRFAGTAPRHDDLTLVVARAG